MLMMMMMMMIMRTIILISSTSENRTGCESSRFCPVFVTQSDSAISQQKNRGGERLFYGAYIGSETRNMEFKRGGGEYLRSLFQSHLRRYACAFLNSGGGTLLIGVDDDGIVRGISCNHRQEDQLRLVVDSILKFFHPPLLPHSYSLTFVPVVKPGPEGNNLKVLRLTLRPPSSVSLPILYQTDQGKVFLRRDGSVEGPLSASVIQEWARQKWGKKVMHLQQLVETLLAERRLLLQEIHHQKMVISSLQNAHGCLTTDSQHPQPVIFSERLDKFCSQTAAMPSDARRCQCPLTSLAPSEVLVSSSTQMAPECATMLSTSSNFSAQTLLNACPGLLQCQQREGQAQEVHVSACSICIVM
ncbi:schlafen-like protein 1 [Pangasianodon hypophthalmus]|uniref:schlafen-like protein 1 n=1 Tax=Pangasianodon hypophthalmus TaxID=310915 RepID=UPI0023081DD9|nr:schlafen-like protein 1 [Pangasianodon hypophthalmus]